MSVNAIYGVVVLYNLALSMYLFLFPLYLDHLVFNPVLIGTLVSVSAVFQVIFRLPMGAYIDRIGEQNATKLSSATFLVSIVFFFARPLLPFFIIIQLFSGISSTLFWPSAQAYVASMSHRTLGYRMGMFNLLTGVAGVVGPLAGGYSKDLVGPEKSFYVLLAVSVVLLLMTLTLPRPAKKEPTEKTLGFLETMLVVIKENPCILPASPPFAGPLPGPWSVPFTPSTCRTSWVFLPRWWGCWWGSEPFLRRPAGFSGVFTWKKFPLSGCSSAAYSWGRQGFSSFP